MPTFAEQLDQVFSRPIAHRGLHGCGGDGPIENTIAAALAAVAGGYGIECDVQLTRDGEAMVFHDATLDRLTGFGGRIEAFDAAEIAGLTLPDGSSVPTLRSFLSAVGGRAPVVIEIKSQSDASSRLAERVLHDMRDYEGAIALKSYDPFVVERCHGADCPVGLVGPRKLWSSFDALARSMPPSRCDFLSWNIDCLNDVPSHLSDIPIMVWVATDKEHRLRRAMQARMTQIVFERFLP